MVHLFCKFVSRADSRIEDILIAYERSPVSTVRLVSETICTCDPCFAVYKSLCIDNPDFTKEVVLYNFSMKMIYDWRLLLDRDIRREFLSICDENEAHCGFKGFFTRIYGNQADYSPILDLESVDFGEDELNFFLNLADSICESKYKSYCGVEKVDCVRYLSALHIYISNPNTKLSRRFVQALQKMYFLGEDTNEVAKQSHLKYIFACVTGLVKRDASYSEPFYPLLHQAILSGVLYHLDLFDCQSLLEILKDLHLLQFLFNRMNHSAHKEFHQYLIRNIENLNILEFLLENKLSETVLSSMFDEIREMGEEADAGLPVSLFIKKLVFIKLRWLPYADDKLSVLTTFDLCKVFDDAAYSLYYLNIFLNIAVPLSSNYTTGKPRLLSILSRFKEPSKPVTCLDSDIKEIIDDIKEIGDYGYDTSAVTSMLIKAASLSCSMAIYFYELFRVSPAENVVIDSDVERLAQLLVKNREYSSLTVLYDRAVNSSLRRDLIVLLRGYVDCYCQEAADDSSVVESLGGRRFLKFISLSSRRGNEPSTTAGDEELKPTKRRATMRSRMFVDLSSDDSALMEEVADNDSISAEESSKVPEPECKPVLLRSESLATPEKTVFTTQRIDDGSISENEESLSKVNKDHAHHSSEDVSKPAQAAECKQTSSDDAAVLENHFEDVAQELVKAGDNKPPEKYSILKDVERLKQLTTAAMKNTCGRTSIMLENNSLLTKAKYIMPNKAKAHKYSPVETSVVAFSSENTKISECNSPTKLDNSTKLHRSQNTGSKPFFDLFIALYDDLGPPVQNIPRSFSNFTTYYNTFNSLRLHDIRASIETSMSTGADWRVCSITSVDRNVEILIEDPGLNEYDLVLFSRDKNLTKTALLEIIGTFGSQELHPRDDTCFVGIVERLSHERNGGGKNPITAYVSVSSRGISAVPKETYHYRVVDGMSTNFREYTALLTMESSLLCSCILNPSIDLQQNMPALPIPQEKVKRWKTQTVESKLTNLATLENSNSGCFVLPKTEFALNDAQKLAIDKSIRSTSKFVLIQGPPGTGKTRVILSIILGLLQKHRGSRILVCTPSNTAIDEILMRMSKSESVDYSFVRVGSTSNPELESCTLDYKASKECMPRGITNLNPEKTKILERASVVCSTLSSCVTSVTTNTKFDYLIVDEACQATELATLVPMKYNFKKVILVGDPKQLPPTTFSKNSQLGCSLFERFLNVHPPLFLSQQYRMHPLICKISSRLFYDGRLLTAPIVQSEMTKKKDACKYDFAPVSFVNMPDGGEQIDGAHSYYNIPEARAAISICKALKDKYGEDLSVIILTPYKAQANWLRNSGNSGFEANTIDAFQGKEADVVILTTVRKSGLGFLCDFRRINVAITRARFGLVILGNYACLNTNEKWKQIIGLRTGNTWYTANKLNKFLSKL